MRTSARSGSPARSPCESLPSPEDTGCARLGKYGCQSSTQLIQSIRTIANRAIYRVFTVNKPCIPIPKGLRRGDPQRRNHNQTDGLRQVRQRRDLLPPVDPQDRPTDEKKRHIRADFGRQGSRLSLQSSLFSSRSRPINAAAALAEPAPSPPCTGRFFWMWISTSAAISSPSRAPATIFQAVFLSSVGTPGWFEVSKMLGL